MIGPYSPGILAGDFLYVSGQGGRDADGQLPGSIEGQVRQTLLNLKAVVDAAGLTLAHVVYSQVYLTDMAHDDMMDRVWREFFPTAPPARAVLGVYTLPTDIAVEINAVAYRDLGRRRPIVPSGHRPQSWSPGVMAGNRLFLSGSLGADDATAASPDPDAQVQLALDNMRQTLAAAGMDFRHVVFVNPYLTGSASRRMNDIYARHFEFGNTPARATISVTSLPGGTTIAFTGVAIADLSLRRAVRPKNMKPSATASPCVMADDTYYCSAKGPFTPGPAGDRAALQGIWVGTVEAQVRQTMRNLLDGLEEAGMGLCAGRGHERVSGRHERLRQHEQDLRAVLSLDAAGAHHRRAGRAGRSHPRNDDTYPGLEQISLIAVRHTAMTDTETDASRDANCCSWARRWPFRHSSAAQRLRGRGRGGRAPQGRAGDLPVDRRRADHQLPRHVHDHRRLGGAARGPGGDGCGSRSTSCRSTNWPMAVGQRLAELTGAEWGMVSAGCAAGTEARHRRVRHRRQPGEARPHSGPDRLRQDRSRHPALLTQRLRRRDPQHRRHDDHGRTRSRSSSARSARGPR